MASTSFTPIRSLFRPRRFNVHPRPAPQPSGGHHAGVVPGRPAPPRRYGHPHYWLGISCSPVRSPEPLRDPSVPVQHVHLLPLPPQRCPERGAVPCVTVPHPVWWCFGLKTCSGDCVSLGHTASSGDLTRPPQARSRRARRTAHHRAGPALHPRSLSPSTPSETGLISDSKIQAPAPEVPG